MLVQVDLGQRRNEYLELLACRNLGAENGVQHHDACIKHSMRREGERREGEEMERIARKERVRKERTLDRQANQFCVP